MTILKLRAYWLERTLIVWERAAIPGVRFVLYSSPDAALQQRPDGTIAGGMALNLVPDPAGLPIALVARFPHLRGLPTLRLPPEALPRVPELLREQLWLAVLDSHGRALDLTGLQLPGVLDDCYAYAGPLGLAWEADCPMLRLWAPTARRVHLHLFADSTTRSAHVLPMSRDLQQGVWSVTGTPDWNRCFYLYAVEVYAPSTGRIERNLVTDPYALSLSRNSRRTQIVRLDDADLLPDGWHTTPKPVLAGFEEIVLYELHVRDFSMSDTAVPAAWRGTFQAFTCADSSGMCHLRELAAAGLTHVHLLPIFDIATIDEDQSQRREPDSGYLATLPPDSEEQQALVSALAYQDGFNWGYDPFHYTTPEGSYSTNPDGPQRIRECRAMIQALNQAGLRVVMDVVYNHTHASGQSARSVLDRIVPGYYHRLDADGAVEKSTCCENTATEHRMMEKLMIDSLLTWARAYRIDGFRFDLMGHHMLVNMQRLRAALDDLTLERDGVDGTRIFVYGEGWDFGEVAENRRGVNAVQANLAGSRIASFNDRLRDGARGGTPMSGIQEQGFITGLWDDPNGTEQGHNDEQLRNLLDAMDWIRIGLAGNLRTYRFECASGIEVRGDQLAYKGAPAGYTAAPAEQIVYVSAHDNETLFDAVQLKAPPHLSLAERVRMHNLGMSLVLLAQGVPFIHAGDEFLRSKSLDRNSFDSGDWFNRIDWETGTSAWGSGLPPAADNQFYWPQMRALLSNPALQPDAVAIQSAYRYTLDMLRIRRSSGLFRLRTAEAVQNQVSFLNTGVRQIPGLILMQVVAEQDAVDEPFAQIVVAWNATRRLQELAVPALAGAALELHPIQVASPDPMLRHATFVRPTGLLRVPPRTTVVFVGRHRAAEG